MLRANMRDGRTLCFDLSAPAGTAEWQARQADPEFQANVTGMAVLWEGEQYALPLPRSFRRVAYTAELLKDADKAVGIRLAAQADDTVASITVYFRQAPKLARYDLRRVGKPRYVSRGRPWPQEHGED